MNIIQLALFSILVFAWGLKCVNAQDSAVGAESIQQQQIAAEEELERDRASKNRKSLIENVEHLTRRAAALRSEWNFAAATEVDSQIRRLCFENNPRLIRANELKRRASDSLLDGNILDAVMYNREADRILHELENEFSGGDVNLDEARIRSRTDQRSTTGISKIDQLERQLQQLATEIRAIKHRIGLPAVWNPASPVTIAITGSIDIDGDGTDDLEKLRSLITSSGGAVVAFQDADGSIHGKIDATTRYLVVGDSTSAALASNQLVMDANKNSVEQIGVEKLLRKMGVRSNSESINAKGFQSRK